MRRVIGVGHCGRQWTRYQTNSRYIVTIQVVWTIYYAHGWSRVTVQGWVWWTLLHATPGWVVCVGSRWAFGNASHWAVISEGIFWTVWYTKGGWIICKGAPKSTVGDTLPSSVLPKGIVGTFKYTGSSCIFSEGPRIGGTSFNASLGGVISKCTVGDGYIRRRNVGIRTHQDTSLSHHIGISK